MTLVEILAILLTGFMLLSMPIAFSLILSAMAAIWWSGANLMIVPQQVMSGIDSFTLLAVPFFLLAGDLMTAGGMTGRLLDFTNALVGRFRGGLAMSNVASATILAGISGSAVADTSALGKVLIPGMIRAGYGPAFSAALTAAANIVGPIIPPSIAFILIGVLTNQSITRLFLAGAVPGLLYSLAMLTVAGWISRRRNYPTHYRASAVEILATFRRAAWALFMPVLIIAGIRSGVFNVTECSAVAVVYALFVGTAVYRELDLRTIWRCLVSTGRSTAIVMIVLGGAQIVSWLLAYENVPQQVAEAMLSVSREPWVFLLLVNVLLLFIGTFMENGPAMVMLVPVLFPIANALGIDPIHFGIVVSVNLVIGLITPPVAICINIAAMIARVSMQAASIEILPFLAAAIAVQLLITFVPWLSLWLPNLMLGAG
ncbi:MAG: TRAP transporter large permease [Alphaproteobacteria bacterium]|nr:TRAP transporter large permease [Alphaproteobacteria bacterium]